jgi:hypothetical protein
LAVASLWAMGVEGETQQNRSLRPTTDEERGS